MPQVRALLLLLLLLLLHICVQTELGWLGISMQWVGVATQLPFTYVRSVVSSRGPWVATDGRPMVGTSPGFRTVAWLLLSVAVLR